MNMNHVKWHYYILVLFVVQKLNKTEERYGDTWHVYSNQNNLYIFTVHDIGKHILLHLGILKINCRIFVGIHQYEHLINIFQKIIKENKDEF